MNGRTEEHRIALFIDFENLVTNTGISSASFDLQPSLDRLLEKGKVVFRRAYCDWSRFGEAKIRLHEFGVELIDVPPSTRAGKNGADMRLVIDALELCYARESIDTFVIGSGDSDFCPLAYKLRENGRTVIGLAVKESTSPLFVKACDEFIYLRPRQSRSEKGDKDKSGRQSVVAEEAGHGKRGAGRHGRDAGRGGKAEAAQAAPAAKGGARTEVPEMAREVVQSLLGRATGPVNPSQIKEAIVRKEPDFDEREHGFSTFARLLAALEQEGLLRRIQQGRQWYVVAPDFDVQTGHGEGKGKKRAAHAEEDEDLESYPDPDEDESV
ncbi:NYN domain-containing protein [Pyxidicoccus parkwayensis]|uniref:NYN domain-containing protein n=1 Tax=Pyxidicoccus parkwayensis TaxID=2813578 RepID=A0ABX7NVI5_9BACT|nr:NYN domain-containing protein [Pyxidicoccus parkwaysis]QSQ21406.1 NYN domain-containing protein [Pyxidicoccus parkwaysis]